MLPKLIKLQYLNISNSKISNIDCTALASLSTLIAANVTSLEIFKISKLCCL